MQPELTIGALSERTGVAASALRFYEAEGLISATRSAGGQRRYARATVRRVSFIRVAQQVGLSLDEIREALGSLPENRTPNEKDWQRLSKSWRPRIDSQIALLERLRDRLDGCIGCGCLSLRYCKLLNPNDAAARPGPAIHPRQRLISGHSHAVTVRPSGRAFCDRASDRQGKRSSSSGRTMSRAEPSPGS